MSVVYGILAGCAPWAAGWYCYWLWQMRKRGKQDRRLNRVSASV